MVSPTNDSYTCNSGASISAGKYSQVPSWGPGMLEVVDASTNTIADLAGGQINSNELSIWSTWSGVAYAPLYGVYGSLVGGGGGHADGNQPWLVRYDIAARQFSVELQPCPVFHNDTDNYVADPLTGWMWADTSGTTVQVGRPFTSHFYSFQIVVPPEAMPETSAPYGYLMTPGRGSMPEGGQRSTGQTHSFVLGTGATIWSMQGTPLLRGPAHGGSIYDEVRNILISIGDSQASATTVFPYINLITKSVGTKTFSALVNGYYAISKRYKKEDCYLTARFTSSGLYFKVIDSKTLQVYTPSPSGSQPVETMEGAWDWVELWNSWVYYPGTGQTIYTLKNTGNPRGDAWEWASQTIMTGTMTARGASASNTPYTRLVYIDAIGTFIWAPAYNLPVQMFCIAQP